MTLTRLFAASLLVLCLSAHPLQAQPAPDDRNLVKEGIALYDRGDYDGAIAKYKDVLSRDPGNNDVLYELGLTLYAKKDLPEVARIARIGLKSSKRPQPAWFVLLGNCLDDQGATDEALGVYEKGLKLYPDDPMLNFNAGLSLAKRNDFEKAERYFKIDVTQRPGHASGQFLLGNSFVQSNDRFPAVFAYLRFLSIESSSERSREAAAEVVRLLTLGVEKKDDKNITISVDPKMKTREGDFGPLAMMMGMSVSLQVMESPKERTDDGVKVGKNQAEKLALIIDSFLAFNSEMQPERAKFITAQYLPFFNELHRRDLGEVFGYVALSSLNLDGYADWRSVNATKIALYEQFLKEWSERLTLVR